MAFPCGQCLPCRLNRRRLWTHRIMLEALQYEQSSFVTLTYADPPERGSLNPDHVTCWLKRFRKRIEPQRTRYFIVGEYGDRSERPHYHAALFGFAPCCGAPVRIDPVTRERLCQCRSCLCVRETWKFGHVMVGTLEMRSAQYIAGYVTKKMTSVGDVRLNGRYPEFARMSLRPGIGASAMWEVASVMMMHRLEEKGEVPTALRHGRTLWPIGRYLRRLLRVRVGLDEKAPDTYAEALRSGLLPVFEAAEKAFPGRGMGEIRKGYVKAVIGESNEQAARNQAAKFIGKKRSI